MSENKVFYHNDLDGEASAAIIADYLQHYHNRGGEYHRVDYHIPPPVEQVVPGDCVFVVDFSLDNDSWNLLLKTTNNVIWIDHHISAIKKAIGQPWEKLSGIREEGEKSGCWLTWEYFYGQDNGAIPPYSIQLISDYDSWTLKEPGSKAFKAYLETLVDTTPESIAWDEIIHYAFRIEPGIEAGNAILSKKEIEAEQWLKMYGYHTTMPVPKHMVDPSSIVDPIAFHVLACNRNKVNSDFFKAYSDNFDLLMPYIFDGNSYTVSIYRGGLQPDFDCSELAEQFKYNEKSGGGHPGAAGFQCEKLPFWGFEKL